MLTQYGVIEFFCNYKENVEADRQLEAAIDQLLANLVQRPDLNRSQLSQSRRSPDRSDKFETAVFNNETLRPTTTIGSYGAYGATSQSFARETIIPAKTVALTGTYKPATTSTATIKAKPYHVESDELLNLKNRKEDFFTVVYVPLSEGDERFLFDLTVSLKYGDNKKIRQLLTDEITNIIKDFPIESFYLQGELLQELFSLMKKSPEDVQYQLTEIYLELLVKMRSTIKLYENPYHANQKESQQTDEFLLSDEKAYIKNSYPTLRPPSLEYQRDPAFQRNQKETFPFNNFLVMDGIVDATVDLIDNPFFADNISEIWKNVLEILRKYKYKSVELVEEAAKDYLRRLVTKLQGIKPEDLYGKIEYTYLFNILYGLFRIFSIEEYQQMQGFRADSIIEILLKGLYRFIYTENEVENILSYSNYLVSGKHSTYQKVMSLLNSVIRLKNNELDLLKVDLKHSGRDPREVQDLVEILEKVLMGVPYASIPNFVELYAELYLYSQIVEGNHGKQMYTRCREMLLALLNVPNQTLKTIVLENILNSLLGDSKFVYRREYHSKKILMFQSLFDEELLTELLFTSLENDLTTNSTTKILLNFLNLISARNVEQSKLSHFLTASTLIHNLTLHENYDALNSVNYAIYNVLPKAMLKDLIADLFCKDQRRRSLAFRYLSDNLFVQKLLTENSKHELEVLEYGEQEKKIRVESDTSHFGRARGEKDPLEGFLDHSSKYFVHQEVAGSIGGEIEGNTDEILKSVHNLMKIASDHGIEYRLRLSSLEQLGEMLHWLLNSLKKSNQGWRKDILSTIEQISELAMESLIIYCKDKHKVKDTGYVARTLGLLNKILGSDAIAGDLAWRLVGPLYDLNSPLMQDNAQAIVSLLVNLLEQRNETARYQALLSLNYIGLGLRLPKEKLPEDWKPSKGAMSLKKFEDKFFIVGQFEWADYESKYQKFWEFLPLDDEASYFINQHVVNAQKLTDPMFSVQDSILEDKCKDFCDRILEETGKGGPRGTHGHKVANDVLLANAEKWIKLVQTMELYFPSRLLEVDVFSMLIKVYSSSLTFAKLRADNTIERITKMMDKLLKSNVFVQEVRNSEPLLQNIVEFLEFMASNVLGPLYELQSEGSREKMDIILSALSLVNRFLSFAHKSKQIKIKHVLAKKVIKQNLIDLLKDLSTQFNNNEELHYRIGKVCRNLLRFPEIYLILNLQPLVGNLFDFMFRCSGQEHFKNKHFSKWFLRFFLAFSLWEEDSVQNTVMQNLSQSIGKLSSKSREIVTKSSWLGWLLRISEDRESQVRIYAWNLMCNLANKNMINDYQSSIETALLVVYAPNEAYGVVTNAINYINKTLNLFMNDGESGDGDKSLVVTERKAIYEDKENQNTQQLSFGGVEQEEKKKLDKQELLRALYRKNIISRVKSMLENSSRSPPVYLCSLAALLRNICVLNPQKAMPVMSQLEFWDLLVELINPKTFQRRTPDKKLVNWGKDIMEVVMFVNNVTQLLIFGMSYEKQVGEYLVYCTQVLKVLIKWLKITTSLQEQPFYKENAGDSFLVDGCSATLVQMLNYCVFLNEDKSIVMINKIYEEKIEKENKESRYNIYLLISKLFTATKSDLLILALFRLLSNLLPKWKKGLHLVESKDVNGETLSESLILNLFGHYKLNDMMLSDNKISWDDYLEAKNTMTSCSCTLLSTSNPAKLAFIYSGYLQYCLKNMTKSAESILLEDVSVSQSTTLSKSKIIFRNEKIFINFLEKSQQVEPQIQSTSIEDIKNYIKLLKYFFVEASNGDYRKEELQSKKYF